MSLPLLPSRFLFRFAVPCRRRDPLWTPDGPGLGEEYRLLGLPELEGKPTWADVRAAWHESGLAFAAFVRGKRQPPWCRESRPEDSDCLQLWIDTRDVHNVHRAGRFCHRFVFLPEGGGPKKGTGPICAKHPPGRSGKLDLSPFSVPVCQIAEIHRAKEHPNPIGPELLRACCRRQDNDYILEVFIPSEALTGFDPAEHPRLGFTYAVIDRELGEQTFGVGPPMPYQEDPSLWPTLDMVQYSNEKER
jgi:hypothetical protein